jgi:phage baseplate assembly protein W
MQFHYPFDFETRQGVDAEVEADHVRAMIEQYLFTNPGERVNRPDFGSGLLQFVHELNSPELAAALQFTLQAGLQRWLGDVIELDGVQVTADDAQLNIWIGYTIRHSDTRSDARFQWRVP